MQKELRSLESLKTMMLVAAVCAAAGLPSHANAAAQSFKLAGMWVEGCSCSVPCPCEIGGIRHGCQAMGAIQVTSGSYGGADLSGCKLAYATALGGWVRIYLDAKNATQRKVAATFAQSAFKEYGKIESVKDAKITIAGSGGSYTLNVDAGKVMSLSTKPVFGFDGKTAITYSNIPDPLTSTMMQAKTQKGSYRDGNRRFELQGTNSFFNGSLKSSGKV